MGVRRPAAGPVPEVRRGRAVRSLGRRDPSRGARAGSAPRAARRLLHHRRGSDGACAARPASRPGRRARGAAARADRPTAAAHATATGTATTTCPTTATLGSARSRALDDEADRRCTASLRGARRAVPEATSSRRCGLRRATWHGMPAHARVPALDALRDDRVLLAPVGVERDRLPGARLPARVQDTRPRSTRAVRASRARSARSRSRGSGRSKPPSSRRTTGPVAPARHGDRRDMRRSAPATSRRGCCPTTAPEPTTSCGATCAASTTTTRSISSSSAAARAAACSRNGWRGRAGRSSRSTPDRSGTRTATGSATSAAPTTSTGPNHASSAATIRSRSARTTPVAASAARWSTSPATRRASIRRTSAPAHVDGVGADWPIAYEDLRPYYERPRSGAARRRRALAVGRPARATRTRPHPVGGNGLSSRRAADAAGHRRAGRAGRDHQRSVRATARTASTAGFCLQGCKVNAKASPLITHVPDALAHGAEIRADCMVSRVLVDDHRRATGVTYFHDGVERRQRARVVAVAGYSIETPRLLLNSACRRSPTASATTTTSSAAT